MTLSLPERGIHFEVVLEYPDGTARRLVSCTYHTRFFARKHTRVAAGDATYAGITLVFYGTENQDSALIQIDCPWSVHPDGQIIGSGISVGAGGFAFLTTARTPTDLSAPPGLGFAIPTTPTRDVRIDCWAWTNVIEFYQPC